MTIIVVLLPLLLLPPPLPPPLLPPVVVSWMSALKLVLFDVVMVLFWVSLHLT